LDADRQINWTDANIAFLASSCAADYADAVKEAPADAFSVPDFAAPLDVDAHLAIVPAGATTKGVVPQSAMDAVTRAGLTPPVFHTRPFRDVSMKQVLQVKVNCARTLYPDAPLREALRRLGRELFPAFTATLLGRVMYGVFRGDVRSILRLANRSFEITQNTGRVESKVVDAKAVRLLFRNTYSFLDSYHYGVIEGTLAACKVEGSVLFRMLEAPHTGEFHVEWKNGR
jgi:uncharacterized protein (TIGR02265 family)